MNKAIKNKRPLILSVVSILLSVVLLVGATVAWFTDTETNKNNRIAAGTLDVMLYMYYMGTDADANVAEPTAPTSWDDITVATVLADLTAGTWYQITDATPADCIFYFDNEVWQPGDEQEIYLAVRNAGTLALDYTLDFVVADEALADALQLAYTNAVSTDTSFTFPTAPEYSTASTYYKTLSSYTTTTAERGTVISGVTQETTLTTGAVDYISLDIRLDESTGDTYQAAAFAMDVILTATQQDQTDTVVKAYSAADITGADANQTVILMQNITTPDAITLTENINIDLNGYSLTAKSFSMATDDYCTVDIAGGNLVATAGNIDIQIKNGTINADDSIFAVDTDNYEVILNASEHTLNLMGTTQFVGIQTNQDGTVEPDTATPASVTIMEDTRVVIATTEDTSFTVSNNVTVEDARSDTAEDGTTEVTNGTVTVIVPAGTEGVEITNTDNTRSTIDTDGEGGYTVDGEFIPIPWDGETITEPTWYKWTDTTSEDYIKCAGTANPAYATVFEVSTAEELAWISALVVGDVGTASSGTGNINYCKIILTENIDLGGFDWEPIGGATVSQYFVFDGQGYTISNFHIDDRDHYGNPNYDKLGFFGNVQYCTIRNVTFKNATITGGTYGIGVAVGVVQADSIIENVNVYDSTVTSSCSGSNYVSGTGYVSDSCGVGAVVGMMLYAQSTADVNIITISNCYSNATVTSDGTSVGGIIGYAEKYLSSKPRGTVTITNCVNEGTITAGTATSTNLYGTINGTLIVDGTTVSTN